MTETPAAQPAPEALLDFAAIIRPDIRRTDLQGAIWACHEAGWDWARTLTTAVRILAHLEEPRDLREAARDPLKRRRTHA